MSSLSHRPPVSVLIPTWNGVRYLRETLDSIFAQVYRPLEIIVSDDGSTDATIAIVKEYQHLDVPLILVENPNKGMVNNWNNCLEHAHGEFVKFVFQDDLITPDCIEKLVEVALSDPEIGLVYSRRLVMMSGGAEDNQHCREIYDGCRDVHEGWGPIPPVQSGLAYLNNPAFFNGSTNKIGEPSVVLLRKSVLDTIGGFDSDFLHLMDFEMWARLMANGKVAFIDEALALFRIHPEQQSVKNLASGEINQDMVRFARKVCTNPLYANASAAFVQQCFAIVEKLLLQYKHESSDFHAQRDNGMRYAKSLEAEVENLKIACELQAHATAREQAMVETLRHDLNLIYNSRSWKLTRPLRMLTHLRYHYRTEGLSGVINNLNNKLENSAPQLSTIPASKSKQKIRPLQFVEHANPKISIVIPVYNKIEYTFHCLASILENSGDLHYEVIVVDDCSSDNTAAVLQQISGIKVIRNLLNAGFIDSCNNGAAAATGEYLLMLNNDTEPQPGWLAALLHTFTDFPDAGMVGAQLLFDNGKLQEAGGIVWRDGSAWNYGRGDDPNHPHYSYCRRVDYCSGACLLLRRADYFEWGGFDTHYKPAYYEDTDLAFKVRAAGKQVYYQPLARVIHFEGITNGTDTSGGVKAYQLSNQQKFFARWSTALASHRPAGVLPVFEKDRHVQKRALVVDARILQPDRDSGSLRMLNLLKILQKLGYKVTFIPSNLHYDEDYTPQLAALGIECWHVPYLHSIQEHLQLYGPSYEVVMLSRADIAAPNIDLVLQHCAQAHVIYDTVDLHFLRERRAAELSGSTADMAAAERRREQELGIARKAHTTLVVSPVEIDLFKKEAPDVNVALVSNIHQIHGCANPWRQREHILFIGTFEHPPNVDAMHHFIDDILPQLRKRNAGFKLLVVGPHAPESLLAKASADVEFLGFVPNIAPLFSTVRLSIAPLRYGAGVKGKINSSMSYGVPVIASPIAAEGMGLVDGVDVLIADTPAAFASAIVRAYDDERLWQQLSAGALANLQRHFSFEVATTQVRAVLARQGRLP